MHPFSSRLRIYEDEQYYQKGKTSKFVDLSHLIEMTEEAGDFEFYSIHLLLQVGSEKFSKLSLSLESERLKYKRVVLFQEVISLNYEREEKELVKSLTVILPKIDPRLNEFMRQ